VTLIVDVKRHAAIETIEFAALLNNPSDGIGKSSSDTDVGHDVNAAE
jgi:hypothetical protein